MKKLALILAMVSLISCIKDKESGVELVPGDRIPEFSVIMNDGTQVNGPMLHEGLSCVVFFTTKCSDCKKALPEIQKFYDAYVQEGVTFVLISREDPYESVSAYWSANNFTMPYSAQSDRSIYELFAKTRVPRIYLAKDGVIKSIFTDSPVPDYEVLAEAVEAIKK